MRRCLRREKLAGAQVPVGRMDDVILAAFLGLVIRTIQRPVVLLENELGRRVQVDETGRPAARTESQCAALQEVEERRLPFLRLDHVDLLLGDQPLDETGRDPGEPLRQKVGSQHCRDLGLGRGARHQRRVKLAVFARDAMDDDAAVALVLSPPGRPLPAFADHVDRLAAFRQQAGDMLHVGADSARRVDGRRKFPAEDQVPHSCAPGMRMRAAIL